MVIDWVRTCHLTRFCGIVDSRRLQWMKMSELHAGDDVGKIARSPKPEQTRDELHDKLRPINLACDFHFGPGPTARASLPTLSPTLFLSVILCKCQVDIDNRIAGQSARGEGPWLIRRSIIANIPQTFSTIWINDAAAAAVVFLLPSIWFTCKRLIKFQAATLCPRFRFGFSRRCCCVPRSSPVTPAARSFVSFGFYGSVRWNLSDPERERDENLISLWKFMPNWLVWI